MYFAASMTLVAFFSIFFFFKNTEHNEDSKSMADLIVYAAVIKRMDAKAAQPESLAETLAEQSI